MATVQSIQFMQRQKMRGRDSSVATGWMIRESHHDRGEIFRARSDRPWGGSPSLLFLGCGVDHQPFIAPRLKKSRAIALRPFQAFMVTYKFAYLLPFRNKL